MVEKPNLYLISTDIKLLVDCFEEYIKKSAEAVSGKLVVDAYESIKNSRKKSEELWEAGKHFEITLKESTQPKE